MKAIKSRLPECPRGLEFDGNGNMPGCKTIKELWDEIDSELIEELGDDYRQFANEERTWWNKKGKWQFDIL
ncbi:MAG: hypothetical protein LBT78_07540 [Tannerella sp.]|jgi:hypothetical protein|nr:hypothetical protein [Tannerella sp.]